MSKYLGSLREACGNTPLWWWVVAALIAIGSLLITLSGSTPAPIRHNWSLFALILFILFFFAVTSGSFKANDKKIAGLQSQIAELRGKADQTLSATVKEAQSKRDDRDVPEVIKELKNELGNWMRTENIAPGAKTVYNDENWYVARMKGKREERIVRIAYKQWKADVEG